METVQLRTRLLYAVFTAANVVSFLSWLYIKSVIVNNITNKRMNYLEAYRSNRFWG